MLVIYKQKGETPLQSLERLRKEKPEQKEAVLSYAGRLDPMAEGVMLILVGDENKDREKYLGLDKTYVTEILLGVGTDTGDVLGVVKSCSAKATQDKAIKIALEKLVGKFEQKYPVYSSKSFAGDYESVHAGRKTETFHNVEIYSAELLEMREIGAGSLLEKIKEDISKVIGDFRQEEIVKSWEENLPKTSEQFQIAQIRLSVSSGFYVRQFAEDLGAKLGLPALIFSIIREKVGEYEIKDCVI